jgi:ATP synthase protein I
MLASYGLVLRRSVLVTAAAAVIMVAVGGAVGGVRGLVGAALAVALVAAFFGISVLVVSRAGRRSQQAAMVAAIVTYLLKIVVLLFIVARFSGTTAFNGRLFGLTAIVCILVWTGAQAVTSMRLKVPYVEVEPDGKR